MLLRPIGVSSNDLFFEFGKNETTPVPSLLKIYCNIELYKMSISSWSISFDTNFEITNNSNTYTAPSA